MSYERLEKLSYVTRCVHDAVALHLNCRWPMSSLAGKNKCGDGSPFEVCVALGATGRRGLHAIVDSDRSREEISDRASAEDGDVMMVLDEDVSVVL